MTDLQVFYHLLLLLFVLLNEQLLQGLDGAEPLGFEADGISEPHTGDLCDGGLSVIIGLTSGRC